MLVPDPSGAGWRFRVSGAARKAVLLAGEHGNRALISVVLPCVASLRVDVAFPSHLVMVCARHGPADSDSVVQP